MYLEAKWFIYTIHVKKRTVCVLSIYKAKIKVIL